MRCTLQIKRSAENVVYKLTLFLLTYFSIQFGLVWHILQLKFNGNSQLSLFLATRVWRVLCNIRPCDQHCWHTDLVGLKALAVNWAGHPANLYRLELEISDRQTRTCSSLTVSALPSLNDRLDILLLQSGIVYLSTAETVLSLLLRHSENILRLICLKLRLSPPSDQLHLRIGLYTYIWRVLSF